MSLRVELAEDSALLKKLYGFRYRMYVDEQRLDPPGADHEARVLSDAHDAFAKSFAVMDQDEVVGSLRLILLDDVPDATPFVDKFQLAPAIEVLGAQAICTTSRFMLDPRLRGGRILLKLMEAAFKLAAECGARLNYGDCSPHMLPFYEHLGYRRYTAAYNDTVYGYKLPILMLMFDHGWFEEIRTPLRRIAKQHADDTEARAWFVRNYGEYLGQVSAAFMPEDGFLDMLTSLVGEDPAHRVRLFQGLDRARIKEFLAEASVIKVEPGDFIVRQGEWDNTLFVLLKGAARVNRSEVPDRTIALLGEGDCFGEIGLVTAGPRTSNVVADTPCECLVLSGDFFERYRRRKPDIAAQLLLNLSAILAHRLAVTSTRLAFSAS